MLQSNHGRTIVPLEALTREDVGLAGGKGANLGELTRADVPVVPGFVVTAPTYFRFLAAAGLTPQIEALLAGLDVGDLDALGSSASAIRGLINAAAMPEAIAAEVATAYRELGEGPVAVRSSATAEDLSQASFAGQQETHLNVEGAENVVRTVQACWASLFEARAVHYRAGAGFAHLDVGIAIVVQRMVQSDRSGVMFTLHPVTNDRTQLVIEAVYGLGEAIVSGMVSPDMYIIDKFTGATLDTQVESQEQQLLRNSDASSADPNVWTPVDWPLRARQKLTDDEISHLANLGLRLEQHFSHPQDIEWAVESGNFYILQSRPVTTTAP